MREKNTLLTIKDPKTDEIIVLRPVTSMYQVEGLREYIEKKFVQFLNKIKTVFVMQEAGKSLSSNDFSDKYKAQLDNLKSENVTNITLNGHTIETVDGTVEINTETVAPVISLNDIEELFKSI